MVADGTKILLPDTTVIEANQFAIKSIKLFNSGSAEIARTFPLPFLRYQNDPQVIEIIHLPDGLGSVNVSVTCSSGAVTILDHYHTSVLKGHHETSTPSSKALRELETGRLRLEDERRLRQQSFAFLTTYMDSLAQCKSQAQPEAAQMVSFFDDFVELGVTRSTVIAELDVKLADADKLIAEEKERLLKLSRELPVRVVTVLSCGNQMPVEAAELTLTYVVEQVSWKPTYDLHVAMTGNTPSAIVRLDFRCTVTQWTGENWENVSLALTTADQVSQLIRLPEPKRIDISLGSPHAVQPAVQPTIIQPPKRTQFYTSAPASQFVPPQERPFTSLFGQAAPTGTYPPVVQPLAGPPPIPPSPEEYPFMRARRRMVAYSPSPSPPRNPAADETVQVDAPSQNVSQLISHSGKDPITHIANGSIFIPSDHSEHHVLVTSLSLQAEFMRVVVPSTDTHVYYTCDVKNTSEYVLLPGTVKTYLNDKHVSSTDIHSTELPQVLECSLAVDNGVKTIHNRVPDALPSVTAFTGKATTTYTSATVIQNTHTDAIKGVIVRSAIPLPADPRITITLKEPVGLAEIDEGTVSVREGCMARWSTTGGRKGKQVGLFEWVCDVNLGATEVLKAVWEVCAPQDLKPFEQVRL